MSAPACANAIAIARPKPRPLAVTRATLPAREKSGNSVTCGPCYEERARLTDYGGRVPNETAVGRIVSLFRYPVKSMAAQVLDEVDVSFEGLAGDRRWAFI